MKKATFLFAVMLILLVLPGCSSNKETKKQAANEKKVELTVSAAASLQDALTEIKAKFEQAYPNVKINYNFGASGSLQQQIAQGAPVDFFFSAAEDQFNKLEKSRLIEKNQAKDLVGNELVLVVPKSSTKGISSFDALSKADKIAVGTPESVPAGKYAKETLEKLKLWDALQGKMVQAKDVRQVLTYVETNNVDAGIVYKTDALISQKVKIAAIADDKTHDPIIYPAGVIKNSTHLKEAEQFFAYLQNQSSIKIFEKYGFKGLKQ